MEYSASLTCRLVFGSIRLPATAAPPRPYFSCYLQESPFDKRHALRGLYLAIFHQCQEVIQNVGGCKREACGLSAPTVLVTADLTFRFWNRSSLYGKNQFRPDRPSKCNPIWSLCFPFQRSSKALIPRKGGSGVRVPQSGAPPFRPHRQ